MAESWFSLLDGRAVWAGAERLTAMVTAIHTVGREAWIQIECAVSPHCSFVLHVTPDTTLHDALRTIEAMVARGAES